MEWFKTFFGEEYLKIDVHEDTQDEVDFLQEKLNLVHSSRILDLCCGYGRHAVELGKRGHRVVGYDLSETLLTRGVHDASKIGVSVTWVRGDVRHLPFWESFDAVISMFNSFGYFEDEAENFQVLKSLGEALKPGGHFLIETVNRDFLVRHFEPRGWFRVGEIAVLEDRQFKPITSRSKIELTVIERGREKRLSHSIRVYTFTELEILLRAAGLTTVKVWGNLEGRPYTWDTRSMILLAQKT